MDFQFELMMTTPSSHIYTRNYYVIGQFPT